MKNILLLVHDDQGQESRLQVALDVTRALQGHLECLEVKMIPLLVDDFYSGAGATVLTGVVEREGKNREELEARLAKEDVQWSMDETFGTYADALTQASDFADLIVVSSRVEEWADLRPQLDPLPLRARRPILAVPPNCEGLDISGCMLIAWDGSRAGNEAVRAAIPLLRRASRVEVIEVNKPDSMLAMTDIATYLSRHGISAELVERHSAEPVADIIAEQARQSGAGLIVMGAYSKPSVVEAVFGGVTRSMLLKSDIPLLLAH